MDGQKVTIHITYWISGVREVHHASNITLNESVETEAAFLEDHRAGRIRLIETHRQYLEQAQ